MPKDAAELLRDALSLPIEARAALADSLLDSLDVEVDGNAEEAWREEIYRRLQQIDSGDVRLIPWGDAQRRLWAYGGRNQALR
jgi:putative addiction module component (TIGR02574 family)